MQIFIAKENKLDLYKQLKILFGGASDPEVAKNNIVRTYQNGEEPPPLKVFKIIIEEIES